MYGPVQPYRRATDNSEWQQRTDRILLFLSLRRILLPFFIVVGRLIWVIQRLLDIHVPLIF
jgi:hypothetical protein